MIKMTIPPLCENYNYKIENSNYDEEHYQNA